jgi:cytosine/adenosine deaminase-related metal-dependent hydrolase
VIAETGGTASVSADVGPHMGRGRPATGPLVGAGVTAGPSIDVCVANGDTFEAMRTAISTQHDLDHDAAEKAGEPLEDLRLTCHDVLRIAAVEEVRGIDQKAGALAPDMEADMILLEADDLALTPMNNPAVAVCAAHPGRWTARLSPAGRPRRVTVSRAASTRRACAARLPSLEVSRSHAPQMILVAVGQASEHRRPTRLRNDSTGYSR